MFESVGYCGKSHGKNFREFHKSSVLEQALVGVLHTRTCRVGCDVGRRTGCAVGCFVGCSVGCDVGCFDG